MSEPSVVNLFISVNMASHAIDRNNESATPVSTFMKYILREDLNPVPQTYDLTTLLYLLISLQLRIK